MKTKASSYRLQYLDWVRGLGSLIMLQGHVFDSFLKHDLRGSAAFVFSQFLGGMPPAIFLFLTGATLAFLMDSAERRGLPAFERWTTALRRSGYLFVLAFAFRAQLWIFGLPAPWTDLFRVDILNCMGFAMAVMSVMALFRTTERVRLCAVLGLAIAFASPLISQMDWSGVPWVARNYIVPDYNFFGFFPWAAYLAFGMSAGSLIRAVPSEATERVMQWGALLGGAAILGSQYFGNLPYSLYEHAEFWLNSPAQVLGKLGVMLVLIPFAFLWTRFGAGSGWSWVRQVGTTSLLVYWVHIELVYGRWLNAWKSNLTIVETAIAAVCAILLMLSISTIRTNRQRLAAALSEMDWWFSPKPDRAEGD